MSDHSLEQGEVMSSPDEYDALRIHSNSDARLTIQRNRKHKHKHKKDTEKIKHEKTIDSSSHSSKSKLFGSLSGRINKLVKDKEQSTDLIQGTIRKKFTENEQLKKINDRLNRKRHHENKFDNFKRGWDERSNVDAVKKNDDSLEIINTKRYNEISKKQAIDSIIENEEDELELVYKKIQHEESVDEKQISSRHISKSGKKKSKFEDSSPSSLSSISESSPTTNSSVSSRNKSNSAENNSNKEDSSSSQQSGMEDDGFYTKKISDVDDINKQELISDTTAPEQHSPEYVKPEFPPYLPALQGCRNVEEFHCLNRIEEGTYGVVYRAKDRKTDEIVALKRLKMEREKEGFPITSLREINTLLKAQHVNIVTVREIVVGSNMDKIFIVMDYVEHDLKSLMESMKEPFIQSEIKTLMIQLLRGVNHMHDNWIIHRDLKTSNLLLSHTGILKIGDFGLAREYGSPLKPYTSIVVTLWYRSPELLLQDKLYTTAIDLWSVGCIFGELLMKKALFPGKSEIDQLNRIFKDLGTPNDKIWPGVSHLPIMKKCEFPQHRYNLLCKKFGSLLTECGFNLMNGLLRYDPSKRFTASEALENPYFKESPLPLPSHLFPTWPAKSEKGAIKRPNQTNTPKAPSGGKAYAKLIGDDAKLEEKGFFLGSNYSDSKGAGFSLKF